MTTVQAGDVVQITDPSHQWYPALVTVTDVKSWGIQGYVVTPTKGLKENGPAYIRIQLGRYEYVGKAVIGTGAEVKP